MQEYTFRYIDDHGRTIVGRHLFENDRDALDAACMTFERFHVQVLREQAIIGAFASRSADRSFPPELVLT